MRKFTLTLLAAASLLLATTATSSAGVRFHFFFGPGFFCPPPPPQPLPPGFYLGHDGCYHRYEHPRHYRDRYGHWQR